MSEKRITLEMIEALIAKSLAKPISYPSGVVPPERAMEAALRDGGCIVKLDPAEVASAAQEARWKAARSARDEARIKAKRWKRGDTVQMGEGDEHDTGEVVSALEHMVRVKWNKANTIYNEDPKDLEWWDGLERAKPTENFDTMPHQQLLDRADELRTEAIPSEAWWCNTCESSFNLTAADEVTSPSCPSCGETLAIHEVAKSRWVRVGRTRTSEPPKVITTPEGFKARVVTLRSTEDKLHEWHREHGGEASLPNRDK